MKIKLAALAMMAVASSWLGGERSHSPAAKSSSFMSWDKPAHPSMPAINNSFTRSNTKRKSKRGKAK